MLPSEIKAHQFRHYLPQAKQVAVSHIALLRRLPLAFLPLLLQQIQQYDWKFPAERREINHQLSYLSSLSNQQFSQLVAGFKQIKLSHHLKRLDWVNSPGVFSQDLSAHLWATHQVDAFRGAAEEFMGKVDASLQPEKLPVPRLGIVIIGKGVKQNTYPLFTKLRPHGTYFTKVDPANGLQILLDAAAAHAAAHPVPYGHWYIDGGQASKLPHDSLIPISYTGLKPVRNALLKKISRAIHGGIGGPEALTRMLFRMRPEEIGLSGKPRDEVLSHFEASIFTQGQGTQIFSTTFVQWTARELLRRAQPLTVVAHFTPRQRQRPMNELLSGTDAHPEPDPMGSLIDADMGAYLTWIDQQRLSGAKQASFLVWFEDHHQAMVVSPYLPRKTESSSAVNMKWLLAQMDVKTAQTKKPPQPKATEDGSLFPAQDNYVLDGIDNNLDSVDFLNGASYAIPRRNSGKRA